MCVYKEYIITLRLHGVDARRSARRSSHYGAIQIMYSTFSLDNGAVQLACHTFLSLDRLTTRRVTRFFRSPPHHSQDRSVLPLAGRGARRIARRMARSLVRGFHHFFRLSMALLTFRAP